MSQQTARALPDEDGVILIDNFSDPDFTRANWHVEGHPTFASGSIHLRMKALKTQKRSSSTAERGEESGDILCLGPGGDGRPAGVSRASLEVEKRVLMTLIFDLRALELAESGSFTLLGFYQDTAHQDLVAGAQVLRKGSIYQLELGEKSSQESPSIDLDPQRPLTLALEWRSPRRSLGHFSATVSAPRSGKPAQEITIDGLNNGGLFFTSLRIGLIRVFGKVAPDGYLALRYAEIRRAPGPA